MSLLDDLRKKIGKKKQTSLKRIVRKATGCPSRNIFIPDKHLDLVDDADAKEFLKQDFTDRETYVVERFDCDDFSRNVYNNARNYGFKVKKKNWCWAEIWIATHALNLYVNQDMKVVFIECQTDEKTAIHSRARFVKF